MDDDRKPEEEQERPRPRVVDKRVSARAEGSAPPPPADPPPVIGHEPAPPPDAPPQVAGGPGEPEIWTPEQEEAARQMVEEFVVRPALEWVVNVAVTLANVAGAKLDGGDIAGAGLTIDALAGLVEGLGPKLAEVEEPLRQTLAQLRMEYVKRAAPPSSEPLA